MNIAPINHGQNMTFGNVNQLLPKDPNAKELRYIARTIKDVCKIDVDTKFMQGDYFMKLERSYQKHLLDDTAHFHHFDNGICTKRVNYYHSISMPYVSLDSVDEYLPNGWTIQKYYDIDTGDMSCIKCLCPDNTGKPYNPKDVHMLAFNIENGKVIEIKRY